MSGISLDTERAKHLWLRISSPVRKRLHTIVSCGLTPQKLALTFCLGTAIGILPLVWGTTLICLLLAHVFRLNQVALQSVNYLLYPAQLALLIPFFKLGDRIFSWGPSIPPNMLSTLTHDHHLPSFSILGWITLKSLAAWLVTVLPVAVVAYGILRIFVSYKNNHVSGYGERSDLDP